MRKAVIALCTLVIVTALPSPALAWGTAAHRFIMRRAIDMLPPELKPFFDRFREEIVVRTIDPDTTTRRSSPPSGRFSSGSSRHRSPPPPASSWVRGNKPAGPS